MRILFYLMGPAPNEKERAAIKSYEDDGHEVDQVNGKYFAGQKHQIEDVDLVVSDRSNVRAAYVDICQVLAVSGEPDLDLPPPPRRVTHEAKGGGWWSIKVDGEEVRSVRKKDLARALEEV